MSSSGGGWSSYKYRFTPWLALNFGKQIRKKQRKESAAPKAFLKTEEQYIQDLSSLLAKFETPRREYAFRKGKNTREKVRECLLCPLRDIL